MPVVNRCVDCLSTLTETDITLNYRNCDNSRICAVCASNYFRCHTCYATFSRDDMEQFDGHEYCQSCLDSDTRICDRCDERAYHYDMFSVISNRYDSVCNECFQQAFFTCDSCNENLPSSRYSAEGLCSSCYDEREPESDDDDDESNGRIHEYSYRPYAIYHRCENEPHNVEMLGIELEVNSGNVYEHACYTLNALNTPGHGENHVYLKHDGSISGGFEIVSHPHTLKRHRELWPRFFASIPRGYQGMTSYKTGQCGMHVHISRSAVSDMTSRRMGVFLNAPENYAYITCIAQREPNHYCKRIEKSMTTPYSYDRYEIWNTTNPRTYELRAFRGSVRKDRFMKNLEFTVAALAFCRVTNYSDLTYRNFVRFVTKSKHTYKYLYNFHVEKGYVIGSMLATEDKRKACPVTVVDDSAA